MSAADAQPATTIGFDPARLRATTRWRPSELVFWLLALAAFFVFPDNLALLSQIAITALFALSLDLILGFAGIISLGHAAFFGIGAYACGLLAQARLGRPPAWPRRWRRRSGLFGLVTRDPGAARRRSHPADGDCGGRRHALGGGEQAHRHHRRPRRPARHRGQAGAGPVRISISLAMSPISIASPWCSSCSGCPPHRSIRLSAFRSRAAARTPRACRRWARRSMAASSPSTPLPRPRPGSPARC